MKNKKPIIGIIADSVYKDNMRLSSTGKKYIEGLTSVTNVTPIIIPSQAGLDITPYLELIDGLMLTGSLSNIHPSHYGQVPLEMHAPYDEIRDQTAFAFVHGCLANAIPMIGVCRGFQELTVALGSRLTPAVHEIDGRFDHRAPETLDRDIKHAPRHLVHFTKDGLFEKWTGKTSFKVNSLHRQAVDKLATCFQVEAVCEDGTIEGVSLKGAKAFTVGVQWHPEFKAQENLFAKAFFRAFEDGVNIQRSKT